METRTYTQLSPAERGIISHLLREGKTLRQIATNMDRSASTISREIRRNKTETKGYQAKDADLKALSRRWKGNRLERKGELRETVLEYLKLGWSPEQISHRLARDHQRPVISYESIYRFIYRQLARTKNYGWPRYLPRGKTKRGLRRGTRRSTVNYIKDRISIHNRPTSVHKRKQIGHWEADLMAFSQAGPSVMVVHERKTRATFLFHLQNKSSDGVAQKLLSFFSELPKKLRKSLTFDNGSEFSSHHQLNRLGIKTYFCDTRSPWQKGGVENAIGRLRALLPRKTPVENLNSDNLLEVMFQYNHHPRKCLQYKTPAEIFLKQLLHFKCERTVPAFAGMTSFKIVALT